MKKFMKKMFSLTFTFILLLVSVLYVDNASALTNDSVVASYTFDGHAAALGGNFSSVDFHYIGSANYLKVDISTSGGDTYDLRYIAYDSYPSERVILTQKKELKAKGKKSTVYFIPPNGSCPSSDSSDCVTVPVIYSENSGVNLNSKNDVADQYFIHYGIEIHNGSILGGTLTVSGEYTFMNY